GETTWRLVKDAVTAEPTGPLDLKGKANRVRAYRLMGVSSGEAIARRVDLPVVGREEEFRRLIEAFNRAIGRSGCEVVTLPGQAGLGKSRLIEEFVRHVGGHAQVLQSRCLSYGEGITFWPIADAFRQAAGILPDDTDEAARAKLWSLTGGLED